MTPQTCFECGRPAAARHHVVPVSLGGTRTVPLCLDCHRAVHSPDQPISLGRLNQLARRRRTIQWRCEVCAETIADDTGYIEVRWTELSEKEEGEAAWQAKHGGEHSWMPMSLTEFGEASEYVPWHVIHAACDPDPTGEGYWIGVERVRNVAQLLEWTAHLLGKTWFPKTDWHRLLERIAQELT